MVGIGHEPPAVGPSRGDIYSSTLPDVGGNVIKGPHPVGRRSDSDRLRRSIDR